MIANNKKALSVPPSDLPPSDLAEIDALVDRLERTGAAVVDLRQRRIALDGLLTQYRIAHRELLEAERQQRDTVLEMRWQIETLNVTHQEITLLADEVFARRGRAGFPFVDVLRSLADALRRFALLHMDLPTT